MSGLGARLIKPLATAVAALLVAGAGALGYRQLVQGPGTYTVVAYFEKAIGLYENSDVTVLGVPVGKVTRVEPDGTRVKVTMKVSEDHRIPAGATAQIIPISVISDRYVQFEPVYTGGPALVDGAELTADRTAIPAELDDVFAQLKKLLDAIEPGEEGEPGALGELIVQLDRALTGREEDLRGTITNAAELTATLATAQDDLSGILVNLDEFFSTIETRASRFGSLNRNLAVVLGTLAESRADLEGTIANLASVNEEVADLVAEHRTQLTQDLKLAVHITSTVLKNESSVRRALEWLPVVALGLRRAYHGGEINAVDIRDNLEAKLSCSVLDDLPDSPIKDELEAACKEETGEPRALAVAPPPLLDVDCDDGARKVVRQLRRLRNIGVPAELKADVVAPLEKKLRRLKKKCRDLGDVLDQRESIDDILKRLLDGVGGMPALDEPPSSLGDLTGSAAGSAAVPPSSGFLSGVLPFVESVLERAGWSR